MLKASSIPRGLKFFSFGLLVQLKHVTDYVTVSRRVGVGRWSLCSSCSLGKICRVDYGLF